ncbi:hypothetical protein LJC64_03415 [Ruminococcaceae bacterium OttesenSCG-928-A11]|nr:hypothetical protein [Ruminococcaceae bacterium OttesenSCG-928-A11]
MEEEKRTRVAEFIEEVDENDEPVKPEAIPLNKRPISHKLYDRMGLNFSVKAINIFIAVAVGLLVLVLALGVFTGSGKGASLGACLGHLYLI